MTALPNLTCVAIAGRALIIAGPPGSGKSSLALALIDRGAQLIGDDGVVLSPRGGRLIASPPDQIAGLIEVRNVGLLTVPAVRNIPVALMIELTHDAPRFVETPQMASLCGADLPLVRLWPDSPVLHLRAEAALNHWGLQ